MDVKICSRCYQEKPLSKFSPRKERPRNPYHSFCNQCRHASERIKHLANPEIQRAKDRDRRVQNKEIFRERARARDLKNPEQKRNINFRSTYGITLETYNKMFKSQHGLCLICDEPETKTNRKSGNLHWLSVDHDHDSGLIRGLLCHRCNMAIGFLKHDVERLKSAILYLENTDAAVVPFRKSRLMKQSLAEVGLG